ncbi:MAG: sensor histidine kinase [Nevskiaceae bacterium]|nr:MAG: sensor histidine kinase [Nevskiaceae bacterium]TBR71346.1 MAG: sensor histidine kinase [Nevskiaceae bacterium]
MAQQGKGFTAGFSVIPDFCRTATLVRLAVILELVALVLTLTEAMFTGSAAVRLLLVSLYVQWVGLLSAAVLCRSRRWLGLLRVREAFFASCVLVAVVAALVSELVWRLAEHLATGLAVQDSHFGFVARSLLAGAVVAVLVLRYFWDRHQWQEYLRTEGEARYLALQARIRPHFLFNALNSVAALVRTRPEKAEDMVLDLADLFRASLDSSTRLISLREEVEIVRGYLRIEEVRLGDRLTLNWDLPEDLMDVRVPRLILQPLVENAVLHGISRLPGRGVLSVIATRQGRFLVIDVENPLPPKGAPEHNGAGMATGNIQQRLQIIYGDRAHLYVRRGADTFGALYRARLVMPMEVAGVPA